jgi:hypothetical protein
METEMKMLPLMMVCLITTAVHADGGLTVAYPDGYRDWRHVKTMELKPGHPLYESFGGLHHIYANHKAVKGYQTGKFADGAVIVFDLLEAKHDGSAVIEGNRKLLGVMARDKKRYGETGGWGFEGFAGGDPRKPIVGANAAKACFECHVSRQADNYLFSSLRE